LKKYLIKSNGLAYCASVQNNGLKSFIEVVPGFESKTEKKFRRAKIVPIGGRHDMHQNDIGHNDIRQNKIRHDGIRHNDIMKNGMS
jgi:hypothetical protein